MSQDPHASYDQTVLELIEHSPAGSVPHTPIHRDALARLYVSRQVYASADYKDGHVTARSLASRPVFHAQNLDALAAGDIEPAALESDASVYDRYVESLPAGSAARAEEHRRAVVGRPLHHRKHHGAAGETPVHDPVHSLFLLPGTGPHPGLPGNYLYGSLLELIHPGSESTWAVQLHDMEDGASTSESASLKGALATLQDVLASAPFHLAELEELGFKSN